MLPSFFVHFQFPGGLPPPGLPGHLGLPPNPGVNSRLEMPPGVPISQPNPANVPPGINNHDKVIVMDVA